MILTQAMKTRTLTFDADGYLLTGTLHLPDEKDPPVVIGAHGLYSSSQSPKQIALANECVRSGIAYFRFDHRGCGDSQGDFYKDTSLSARCDDLLHAVSTVKKEGFSCRNLGLFGSSMGGVVCMTAASELSVDTMVINAAPTTSDRLLDAVEKTDPAAAGASVLFKHTLSFDLTRTLKNLHHILIFHGDADDVVPIAQGRLIHEHATSPKRMIVFDNGDHVMSNPVHQKTFTRESVQWFRRYL